MKQIKCILGCALAAGLMTFAPHQTQAGVVIGNQLYSPLKIKLTVGSFKANGSITKVSITSKEVLKLAGFPKNAKLAIIEGMVNYNSIFVISKDTVLENLTAQGILTANLSELLDYPVYGTNGQFKYKSSGVLSLNFYSNPQFVIVPEALLFIGNPDIDQVASENASDYWFEVSGLYSYSENGSPIKNAKQASITALEQPIGTRHISNTLKATSLSGTGFDIDLDAPSPTTVRGSVSASGSGKVPAVSIY